MDKFIKFAYTSCLDMCKPDSALASFNQKTKLK